MRVFLSWSGDHSKQIAMELMAWLPCVIQQTVPFISSNSIVAGERWHSRIDGALDEVDFGIIIVTKENKANPWLLYEAGALSKNVSKSRVIPVLVNLENIDLQKNPLIHFQTVPLSREGIADIVNSVHLSCDSSPLSDALLSDTFDTWWPKLEEKLAQIEEPKEKKVVTKKESEDDRLAGIENSLSNLFDIVTRSAAFIRNSSIRDAGTRWESDDISYVKNHFIPSTSSSSVHSSEGAEYARLAMKIQNASSLSTLDRLANTVTMSKILSVRYRHKLLDRIVERQNELEAK